MKTSPARKRTRVSASERTRRRKDEHLDLCADEEVEPSGNSTLFDCVHLVHDAMPELGLDDIDLSTTLFGKRLSAPLIITGMTGGTPRAKEVNKSLAALAQKLGLAFGVGSQRAMAESDEAAKSFEVRSVAPDILIFGNLGLRTAAALGANAVRALADRIGADAMAIHLNVAQELTQPEGDRDFKGGWKAIESLAEAFPGRLLVKETGCGLSPKVSQRLINAGVAALDVSGLGGTSWVRVEQLRADTLHAQLGADFSGWGIPSAAAVAAVRRSVGTDVPLIASGGIRNGLEVAKAIALGADLAGMALPVFKALSQSGTAGAEAVLRRVIEGIRQAMLLSGSSSAAALKKAPRVVTGDLKDWLSAL